MDKVNSQLEDRLCGVMDSLAPFKTIQVRAKYKNWVSTETKTEMLERDRARDRAKLTDDSDDWEEYRQKELLYRETKERQGKISKGLVYQH